ncbi:hypothetical protein [Rhodospirillum rubrum]|nr:hypothetical protein [Rhodospirillum rubrum]
MLLPVAIWVAIEVFVLPTPGTVLATADRVTLGSLGAFAVVAMGLLSWWMGRAIARTPSPR